MTVFDAGVAAVVEIERGGGIGRKSIRAAVMLSIELLPAGALLPTLITSAPPPPVMVVATAGRLDVDCVDGAALVTTVVVLESCWRLMVLLPLPVVRWVTAEVLEIVKVFVSGAEADIAASRWWRVGDAADVHSQAGDGGGAECAGLVGTGTGVVDGEGVSARAGDGKGGLDSVDVAGEESNCLSLRRCGRSAAGGDGGGGGDRLDIEVSPPRR